MEQISALVFTDKLIKLETEVSWLPQTLKGLTFDSVSFVEVNLALGLSGVRTDHHEMSPWNSTVQLPPGAQRLTVTAGTEKETLVRAQLQETTLSRKLQLNFSFFASTFVKILINYYHLKWQWNILCWNSELNYAHVLPVICSCQVSSSSVTFWRVALQCLCFHAFLFYSVFRGGGGWRGGGLLFPLQSRPRTNSIYSTWFKQKWETF